MHASRKSTWLGTACLPVRSDLKKRIAVTNDMLNAELAKASEVDAENKVCQRLGPLPPRVHQAVGRASSGVSSEH